MPAKGQGRDCLTQPLLTPVPVCLTSSSHPKLWPAEASAKLGDITECSLNLGMYHHEVSVSAEMLELLACASATGPSPLGSTGALLGPEAPRLKSPLPLPFLLRSCTPTT